MSEERLVGRQGVFRCEGGHTEKGGCSSVFDRLLHSGTDSALRRLLFLKERQRDVRRRKATKLQQKQNTDYVYGFHVSAYHPNSCSALQGVDQREVMDTYFHWDYQYEERVVYCFILNALFLDILSDGVRRSYVLTQKHV
ncbi:hypothetical protein AVEN_128276-1 [Araneus ventricosus]|uniref:Uncharacterized protein n=1 Tax=Araneus ventricosus TaxID=182803 RepID=A0A4Y2FVE8_ARAVE|nr:hypothetical protein AVEN_128276-1 [Araneus ventricosus]